MKLIKFLPHKAQREILDGMDKINLVICGRRAGKSLLAAYLAIRELLHTNRQVYIVAPNYSLTQRIWDYLLPMIQKINAVEKIFSVEKYRLRITNNATGSWVECKSADNPASLLGIGLDLCIIDEIAQIPEVVWRQYLEPTLLDRKGSAFLIGTPMGLDWVHDMFYSGAERLSVHRYTSYDNPYNSDEELERLKRNTPEDVFRQEYMAEFVDAAGLAFKGWLNCIDKELVPLKDELSTDRYNVYEEAIAGHTYMIGYDPARSKDWAAFVVVDVNTRKAVHVESSNKADWAYQKRRAKALSDIYNKGTVVIDVTKESCLAEDLMTDLVPVQKVIFDKYNKHSMVENLKLCFEKQTIKIPNDKYLIKELGTYRIEQTVTGTLKYNAPEGGHDDLVCALMLAMKNLGPRPIDLKTWGGPGARSCKKFVKVY